MTPDTNPAWTRIAVTTRFTDGRERTFAIETPTDGMTTDEFRQSCEQLALVVGYDPKCVKKAFHG